LFQWRPLENIPDITVAAASGDTILTLHFPANSELVPNGLRAEIVPNFNFSVEFRKIPVAERNHVLIQSVEDGFADFLASNYFGEDWGIYSFDVVEQRLTFLVDKLLISNFGFQMAQ